MNERPVGVAVVGIGMWGKGLSTALQKSGAFRIVTCFTRTKAKRDQFTAEFQCDQESSYENVLKRKDVEAIMLTNPNSVHAEYTIMAAEKGKHVLVEKPLANRVSDARQMIDRFERFGGRLGKVDSQFQVGTLLPHAGDFPRGQPPVSVLVQSPKSLGLPVKFVGIQLGVAVGVVQANQPRR